MTKPNSKVLRDLAIEAAYQGGRRAMSYFNKGIAIETKSDSTPVTRADREAEEVIRSVIAKQFPDHTILGEEAGEVRGSNEKIRWIIDPVDGTKAFIHGVPLWGVLIGVEVDGRAEVGVIYIPVFDEIVSAARGFGCEWNHKKCSVSKVNRLEDSLLLTSSFDSCVKRSSAYSNLSARTKLKRGWGDCYGYVLVATGRAEIMVDPNMNPWDCAPMLPILEEAGGKFTDWKGNPTIWGKDAVASNGILHEEVMRIIKTSEG